MRILLTNDDGINARGLDLLETIARQFSDDIWVVAPTDEQSGAGHSLTLTQPDEAIGVVRAADSVGLPVAIGFTVETDGRLPDGTTLRAALERVDAEARPAYFLVNCAHPVHVLEALAEPGEWTGRIHGLRSNASIASHAELDEAEVLDEAALPAERETPDVVSAEAADDEQPAAEETAVATDAQAFDVPDVEPDDRKPSKR